MTSAVPQVDSLPLVVSLRRVAGLSAIAGYVEVIGYADFNGIYPAIMTGNTVQLGLTLVRAQWVHFRLLVFAIGLFFVGAMIASLIRRHLRRPPLELLLMGLLLIVAGIVRLHPQERIPVELPLLALALAMQGETISRFGGVSLQSIVVTNNMVKFSDALVGRYLSRPTSAQPSEKPTELKEVLLPGLAWLSYSIGAGAGAVAVVLSRLPMIVPAVLLILLVADLLSARNTVADS